MFRLSDDKELSVRFMLKSSRWQINTNLAVSAIVPYYHYCHHSAQASRPAEIRQPHHGPSGLSAFKYSLCNSVHGPSNWCKAAAADQRPLCTLPSWCASSVRTVRHRQFHAGPEMLTILAFSLLSLLLLCEADQRSFDEELLLHPDLVEEDFSPRQSNSTAAATASSLVFGAAAVLVVTGNDIQGASSYHVYQHFL